MPNNFIIIDVGVITAKKIIPIINGDINFPNKIPNLNQILFSGDRIDEFNKPKIKNINETIVDHILIFSSFKIGNIDIIKKNTKNTIPKLLFEPIVILFFCKLN